MRRAATALFVVLWTGCEAEPAQGPLGPNLPDGSSVAQTDNARPDSNPSVGDATEAEPVFETPDAASGIAMVALEPSAYTFADVAIGVRGLYRSFRVNNIGVEPAGPFGVSVSGTDPNDFVLVANGCPGRVQPGRFCDLTVAFEPTTAGPRSATLQIDDGGGVTAQALLQGNALPVSNLVIDPGSWDFGSLGVGQTASRTFVVRNRGTSNSGALTLQIPDNDGAFVMENFCGASLMPASECSVRVTFRPTSAGMFVRSLSASASVGGVASAQLSGVGSPAPLLKISPSTHNFGLLKRLASGSPATFEVTSSGPPGVETGLINVVVPSGFSLSSNTCSYQRLSGNGGRCSFNVHATSSAQAGDHTLKVSADPGGEATATLSLQRDSIHNSLVAYWSFDNDLTDSSGNNNHGTFVKGRTERAPSAEYSLVSGKRGRAAYFGNPKIDDGVFATEWIKVLASDSINETGSTGKVTITAWVKADDFDETGDDLNFIVSRHEFGTAQEHFGIALFEGAPTMSIHFFYARGTASISVGGWHHIAGTYDGIDQRVYVDGVLKASASIGWPIAADSTLTIIGANQNIEMVKEAFRGAIDEVRLYSVDLTEAEIKAEMAR